MADNWEKVSIGLVVFGFINFILFIAFSEPFNEITGLISDLATDMGVQGDVQPFLTMLSTIFGLVFTLSMFGLAVWFFLGGHSEEYEEYPREYRR